MNSTDAAYMEGNDPEYRPDAPDGDAAREEAEPNPAVMTIADCLNDEYRPLWVALANDEAPQEPDADDGSNPFADWPACSPPLDAYCTPDTITALACADGSFQSFALSPTYEEAIQGARERAKRLSDEMREEAQKALLTDAARRQAVEACWPRLVGGEYPK